MMDPPPLHPSQINPQLLGKCIKSISTDFSEGSHLLKPTDALRKSKTKIPASDLKIGMHFEELDLESVFHEDGSAKTVATDITSYLEKLRDYCKLAVIPAIAKCDADVMENLSILKNGIRSEMELRFAVADPILRLLCSYWRRTVCGEVAWNITFVAGCLINSLTLVGETGGGCKGFQKGR